MIQFSELQLDALGEVFNIGVGRAASSLSEIVRDEVELSAPMITLVPASEVATTLLGSEFSKISMVTVDFSGPFDARSMLIFPERNALAIIGNMLEASLSPEELAEFEQEAMCEVGNIILNACISALADLFDVEFHGGLPVHHFGDSDSIAAFGNNSRDVILVLEIDLTLRQQHIKGNLMFLLSVSSLSNLLAHVDQFLIRQGMA
ncbi:MAG TPA: chemotaxis protein CheX [Accumulibacter sp.]|jgi:chemotaxis protein CheC|nr:chemotaxis protein CheX [Accumulibacter sp.]